MSGADERFALDANVLVYAVDADAGAKHRRAKLIVDRAPAAGAVLPLQALGEFFSVVTRKGLVPRDEADTLVSSWLTLFEVQTATPASLSRAMAAFGRYRLPFWDAMIWSVVRQAGCKVLLTEDFQTGASIEGVTFLNPFAGRSMPAAVSRLL